MATTSPPASPRSSVADRVALLQEKLAGLTTAEERCSQRISTGYEPLDALLPGHGLHPGMLVEWLAEHRGSGAGSLALLMAKRMLQQQPGCLVVTDRWRRFYPPAAMSQGISASKLIVVQADSLTKISAAEELWALNQALRCPGVSAVMAWMEQIEPRAFRRLQLAAESGKTLALFIRPASVRSQPTWSDVQLLVTPRPSTHCQGENRCCRITLLRQRSRAGAKTLSGASVELEMDEQQGLLQDVGAVCRLPA